MTETKNLVPQRGFCLAESLAFISEESLGRCVGVAIYLTVTLTVGRASSSQENITKLRDGQENIIHWAWRKTAGSQLAICVIVNYWSKQLAVDLITL